MIAGVVASILLAELLGLMELAAGLFVPFFRLGTSDSADSDSDSDSDSSPSCPYFYTWDGEKFRIENDFLIGFPSTFFSDYDTGQKKYGAGETGPDLYKLKNAFKRNKEGKLVFQIREIEPEESFIDHLALTRVVYPKDGELIVDSTRSRFWIFAKQEVDRSEGVENQEIMVEGKKVPPSFSDTRRVLENKIGETEEYTLESGDVMEISGNVTQPQEHFFLLLGSWYRDWTAGEIPQLEKASGSVLSSFLLPDAFSWSVRGVSKVALFFLMAGVVWTLGTASIIVQKVTRGHKNSDQYNETKKLADAFGTPEAFANFPHSDRGSLMVEYWNWNEGVFQLAHIIQPRAYRRDVEALALPQSQAVNKEGKARVRITATKRHIVSSASFFAPKTVRQADTEKLSVVSVSHDRLGNLKSEVVEKQHSGGYLHTISGDKVEVVFDGAASEIPGGKKEAYLLSARGFYTPLSDESARLAGNWVDKLDPESRRFLEECYSLKDYHSKDRTPVLS